MKRRRLPSVFRSSSRTPSAARRLFRRAVFENLESRQVLAALTLAPIADQTVLAGAPLHLALDGFDADSPALTFRVEIANNTGQLTATIPEGNPSLKISVLDSADGIQGDMVFELFRDLVPNTVDRITALAADGFYNNVIFHRVIKDFMIQGGDPTGTGAGGSGVMFDDEFSTLLQHTSAGVLSMAKSSDDTNDSQFFITSGPTRWLDYNHSVFGFLTEGDAIREQIENVSTNASDRPVHDVVMTGVTVFFDQQNRVLRLSAPHGASGSADVTVYVSDGQTEVAEPFHVTIAPDTGSYSNSPPYLQEIFQDGQPVSVIQTVANHTVTVGLVGVDVEGDPIVYGAWPVASVTTTTIQEGSATTNERQKIAIPPVTGGTFTLTFQDKTTGPIHYNAPATGSGSVQEALESLSNIAPGDVIVSGGAGGPWIVEFTGTYAATDVAVMSADGWSLTNANLTASTSGQVVTITPRNSIAGVYGVLLTAQASSTGSADSQVVPLYIRPAAPTSVELLASSDTGPSNADRITNLDNTPGKTLSFRVHGVVPNAEVELLADGQVIGKATAGSVGSVVILTEGTFDLADGSHTITARQTLRNQPVHLGNVHTTVDLASDLSTSMTIVVDTVPPQITSTPPTTATEATAYAYDVETDEEPAGAMSYRLTTAPAGMTIDAASGLIRWTPADGQGGSRQVTVQATDKAGNVVEQSVTIAVTARNQIPLAFAQTAATPQNHDVTIVLAGDDGDAAHNQTLQFGLVDPPSHGTIHSFNAETGELIYSPDAGFSGEDTFTFTVTDSDSDEGPGKTSTPATGTVHVTKVNASPVADDQTVTLAEDGSILITLTGDDGDPEATQTLTFAIVQAPQHGVLSGFHAAAGTVTYRPHPNYAGTDRFTFTVTDDATEGEAAKTSAPATISLSITAVNDAPRVTQGPVRIALNDPATWSFKLSANDGDPEVTQQLTFAITVQPRSGQIAIDSATGDVTYTPHAGFRGTDRFVVTVTDDDTAGGAALTSVATTVPITVFVKNMPPVGTAQDLTVAEDGTLRWTLSGDDGDPEVSQPLSFAIHSGPSHGQIRLDPSTGQAVYVPAPDFNGLDRFEFSVSDYDGHAEPTSATSQPVRVTITVTPVDDAPRFEPVALPTALAGVRWTAKVQARDPDGLATIEYGLEPGAPEGMQIDPTTGEISWTPPDTWTDQTVSVTVRATEVLGGQAGPSAVQRLEIQVQDLRGLVLHSTAEELIRQRQSDEAATSQATPTGLVLDPTWLAEASPTDRVAGGLVTGGAGGLDSGKAGLDALSAGDYGIGGTYGTDTGWGSNAPITPAEEPVERKLAQREPTQPAEEQTSQQTNRNDDTSEPRATPTDGRADPVVAWDAATPPAAADAAIESLAEADPVEEAIAALAEAGAMAFVESGEE